MGKPSKRPGRAARDIHAAIKAQAETLRRAPGDGLHVAPEGSELGDLLTAARAAVECAIPSGLEFHGRRYYIRVRQVLQLDVFDAPAAADPLVRGVSFSTDEFGHAPGH